MQSIAYNTFMRLFHVSEDPTIKEFSPLPPPNPEAGVDFNAVWAINEEKLPNYLLPRDCPRICFIDNNKQHQIIVETGWLRKIKDTVLYLYQFDGEGFELHDPIAGYYLSRRTAYPQIIRKITDPLIELEKRNIKFSSLDNLHKKKDEVVSSYKEFSIIRFRNAAVPS